METPMTDAAATAIDTAEDKTAATEKWAYLIALALVALLAVNTALFGLAGLSMTAVALVPVIFITLLIIMVGG